MNIARAVAKAEGLEVYEYRTHCSPDVISFLGHDWEDGSVQTDARTGEPACDSRGNILSWWQVRSLTNDDQALIDEWWD